MCIKFYISSKTNFHIYAAENAKFLTIILEYHGTSVAIVQYLWGIFHQRSLDHWHGGVKVGWWQIMNLRFVDDLVTQLEAEIKELPRVSQSNIVIQL